VSSFTHAPALITAVLLAAAAQAGPSQAPSNRTGLATPTSSVPSVTRASSPFATTLTPTPPAVAIVHLAATYSPDELRLKAGQRFLLVACARVQARGGPVPAGLLKVRRLAPGHYLYTALRPGTAVVITTVRPRCPPGSACPQWAATALLRVTIT
jgi:hypothetical protein